MAVLDLNYYKGQDEYSDGEAIEDHLLSIARSHIELENVPQEQIDFPTFYHFSPIREGICCWYPFSSDAEILEIGSGCGAITGGLCRNGSTVTSVELSRKRASVNYYRHQELGNLTIRVGNHHDMPDLVGRFDFVVVVGVMEYAGKFSGGEDPYLHFLMDVKKYLKPDGKLLLAIENRLGMKYFSGADEDHLNAPFIGLRNYPDHDEVHTFSKGELTELLASAGFEHVHFYYPYPDYKFPSEIFSDVSLKTMGYGKPFRVYDKDRVALFPEAEVAAQFAKEGAGGAIANSFFVEASVHGQEQSDALIYAKLNLDRPVGYRISTEIWENQSDGKYVIKRAQSREALAHIARIADNEKRLDAIVPTLQGKKEKNFLKYAFEEESNLEDRIMELIRLKDPLQARQLVLETWNQAFKNAKYACFSGERFASWFGAVEEEREALCVDPANVDMILQNAFLRNGRLLLIDCEWVTDFPVPVKFIQWRMLRSLYASCPSFESLIPWETWMKDIEISEKQIAEYDRWEKHFERTFGGEGSVNAVRKSVYPLSSEKWEMACSNIRVPDGISGVAAALTEFQVNCMGHIQDLQSRDEVRGLQLADLKNEIHVVQHQGNRQETATGDLMKLLLEQMKTRDQQLADLKNEIHAVQHQGNRQETAAGDLMKLLLEQMKTRDRQLADLKGEIQALKSQLERQERRSLLYWIRRPAVWIKSLFRK